MSNSTECLYVLILQETGLSLLFPISIIFWIFIYRIRDRELSTISTALISSSPRVQSYIWIWNSSRKRKTNMPMKNWIKSFGQHERVFQNSTQWQLWRKIFRAMCIMIHSRILFTSTQWYYSNIILLEVWKSLCSTKFGRSCRMTVICIALRPSDLLLIPLCTARTNNSESQVLQKQSATIIFHCHHENSSSKQGCVIGETPPILRAASS